MTNGLLQNNQIELKRWQIGLTALILGILGIILWVDVVLTYSSSLFFLIIALLAGLIFPIPPLSLLLKFLFPKLKMLQAKVVAILIFGVLLAGYWSGLVKSLVSGEYMGPVGGLGLIVLVFSSLVFIISFLITDWIFAFISWILRKKIRIKIAIILLVVIACILLLPLIEAFRSYPKFPPVML